MDDSGFCRLDSAYPHMLKNDIHPVKDNYQISNPYNYSYIESLIDNLRHQTQNRDNNVKSQLLQIERDMNTIKQSLIVPEKLVSEKSIKQTVGQTSFWDNPDNINLIRILIITGIIVLVILAFVAICSIAIGFSRLNKN